MWLVKFTKLVACKYKGSEELDASYDAVSDACLLAIRFSSLLSSLAISSPLSFDLVVGPHMSLLSPGSLVTNKQTNCTQTLS